MNVPAIKITRHLDARFPTKARHLFAIVIEVGQPDQPLAPYHATKRLEGHNRYAGISSVDGSPTWIVQSAPRAHKSYRWYTPGDWYDFPQNERVIAVHLYREDGKSWHKDVQGEEVR